MAVFGLWLSCGVRNADAMLEAVGGRAVSLETQRAKEEPKTARVDHSPGLAVLKDRATQMAVGVTGLQRSFWIFFGIHIRVFLYHFWYRKLPSIVWVSVLAARKAKIKNDRDFISVMTAGRH